MLKNTEHVREITGNVIEPSLIIRTDCKVFNANVGCLMLSCNTAALKLL